MSLRFVHRLGRHALPVFRQFACLVVLTPFAFQSLWAAPQFLWAQPAGSMYPDTNGVLSLRAAVATDAAGNVYVAGGFRGDATFGTNSLSSFGPDANADVFIAKYDPAGQVLWIRQVGGIHDDNGNGIAVDAKTNIYVTGHFQGEASFGTTNVTGRGWEDAFVAKYDADGMLLWVRTAGGEFRDQGQALALDGQGNVCVTGEFSVTAAFGPFSITSVWSDDIFITKLDKDGNFLWATGGGGVGQDFGFGIAADQTGNVYITGYIGWTNTFGNITVPPLFDPPYWYDILVAKFSPTGVPLWVRRAGGAHPDGGEAVAVDRSGNVYVTGWLTTPSTFGPTNVTRGHGFLAKYSTLGEFQWVRAGDFHWGLAATCDAQGNVYVAGEAVLSAFEGGQGGVDITVHKYDPGGTLLWRQNAGSSGRDSGLGIALDSVANVYLCGAFQGNASDFTARFGSVTLTNSGLYRYDNFVAKLESSGVPLHIHHLAGKVKLSWSLLIQGLTLQHSTNLRTWTTVSNASSGIELPATASQTFFRLIR